MDVPVGSANVSIDVVLRSISDGTEVSGKLAADCVAKYWRPGEAPVAITLTDLATDADFFSEGGFRSIAGVPGSYRLDVPDAAWAAGAPWVEVDIVATGVSFHHKERFPLDATTEPLASTVSIMAGQVAGLAVTTPEAIAAAVWSRVLETQGAITAQQILSIGLAVWCGVTDDTGGGGVTFKTPNGQAIRLEVTRNVDDERLTVTLSPSA
jgi:hypothetical protein